MHVPHSPDKHGFCCANTWKKSSTNNSATLAYFAWGLGELVPGHSSHSHRFECSMQFAWTRSPRPSLDAHAADALTRPWAVYLIHSRPICVCHSKFRRRTLVEIVVAARRHAVFCVSNVNAQTNGTNDTPHKRSTIVRIPSQSSESGASATDSLGEL